MIAFSYCNNAWAPAKSPMFKQRTRTIVTLALFSLPLLGCRAWQPLWPAAADKSAKSDGGEAEAEMDKPRVRTTGRSPIKSTGINEQSREIERSLGAQ